MDVFYIVFGFILFVMGWLEFAYSKLMRRKREAGENWGKIESMLKARASAVLELLEAVSAQVIIDPEMEILFELKGGYLATSDRDHVAEIAEKTTPYLYALLEKISASNIASPKITEIIGAILEMDEELEVMAGSFNKYVYLHNEIIGWKKYKLQIMVLRPNPLRDFKLKREL